MAGRTALACTLALFLNSAEALRNDAGAGLAFSCPEECLECCSVPWAAGLGVSGTQFKCILKDPKALPQQRNCTAPEERWHAKPQSKTTCSYTLEERGHEAWDTIEPQCSKYSQCCCRSDEDWSENVCKDMHFDAPEVFDVSPTSGVREKYLRLSQQYDNKRGNCTQEEGRHAEALPYQTSHSSSLTSEGCCLATEARSSRVRYRCGTQRVGVRPPRTVPRYCHKAVAWTGCASWQRLYHCTGDGGLTQSGQLYQRVSSAPGLCLGDRSTPERLMHALGSAHDGARGLEGLRLENGVCPAGTASRVAGQRCACEAPCGDGWHGWR